ncbi:hypothetical protein QBC34DRAFT_411301 [Podospora aff. communis PSN243]|uniref:Uncharacterized protein n=1 Tax=Podospora aff. communis PSN243 TaxID=3040156 RepID=A0AAV9GEI8_9PEZI|nr:hypothetical protein QBC34DRAFT_411301 [Podospora aff. communis PSN243]
MAEIAAGALVAEQVVATGVEAAAVAAVAAPTQPLKVALSQLARVAKDDSSPQTLGRCNHTLTTIRDKAYIFGGEGPNGELCASDVHAITIPTHSSAKTAPDVKHLAYKPFPLEDVETGGAFAPAPRAQHAACAKGKYLIIHGGRDVQGSPIGEDNCLWLWDTEALQWSKLRGETQLGKVMAPRYGHHIFVDPAQDFLILHGGHTIQALKKPHEGDSAPLSNPKTPIDNETWLYDFDSRSWTVLPDSPSPAAAAAYADTTLYTISRSTSSPDLSGSVNYLRLLNSPTEREKPGALTWKTHTFPTNPLTPGPHPREGAALVPLSTGHGRHYLVYMFGCADAGKLSPEGFYSDIWTLQLPSHGFTAAAAKDKIRDKLLHHSSGTFSWASAELIATEQMHPDGKVHPGPRALFGADSCFDGKGVLFWGGINAKGEREADGWILALAYGYADNDRFE